MESTINAKEIEKFSAIADEWWNVNGKFKPLHKFNPIRISFIRQKIIEHFSPNSELDEKLAKPFVNLKILDIGCGGGLISEPFARMGAKLTAIDASEKNIQIAKIHAKKSDLEIDYHQISAEDFLKKRDEKFDVVLALEIVEHVSNVELFIKSCSSLVKVGGLVFIATMNKTVKSLLLAKFAAEYVLRWLPIGTHDWKQFLKPSELNFYTTANGLDLQKLKGFSYNFFKDEWSESEDLAVNYIAVFLRR